MSWETELLPASFRGVPFQTTSAQMELGRRIATHEFPRSNVVEHEDLGARDQVHSVRAYLVGKDYLQQKKKFEDALNLGTEGVLVHPYRGTQLVLVGDVSAAETNEAGGMVAYTIVFVPQSTARATRARPNTRWKLSNAKSSIQTTAGAQFVDRYAWIDQPVKALQDVRATLGDALSFIDTAKRVAGSAAAFKREIANLKGQLIALSLNAEYLANSFTDLIDFGTSTGSSLDQFGEQREIATFRSATIGNVPTGISESALWPAYQVENLIKHLAIASQVGLVADLEFSTVDDADATRDQLFSDIDDMLTSGLVTDGLYGALRDAKVAVFEDLEYRTVKLPRVIEYTSPEFITSLELNYSLYGSLDNEEDFIKRNSLIHPGFVPVGIPLEIITADE